MSPSGESGNDHEDPLLAGLDSWLRRISPRVFEDEGYVRDYIAIEPP